MKIYADTPARRTRQVISDIWFVVWAVLWIWLAVRLHDLIVPLGTLGRSCRQQVTPGRKHDFSR